MSKEDNIAAMSMLLPIAQRRDWERLGETFAPHVVDHGPLPDQPPGLDGLKWFWHGFATAFPDFKTAPVVLCADEDHVALVADFSGTHTGEYLGHAPTGRCFSIQLVQIVRFADGHIVEVWGGIDSLKILRQLGCL
jgi:predicted ester cyclase